MAAEFALDDCWALRRGQMHVLYEASTGAMCRHFEVAPKGPYLCVPLSVHGEDLGLLQISANPANHITDDDQRLALTFSGVVKLSLSNLKLRSALRDRAIHDRLTGLYNRHFDEMLAQELQRARRKNETFSLQSAGSV